MNGKLLLETDVAKTETGTPDLLNMYAGDIKGPGAIVRAGRELRAGRGVAFAVTDRLPAGSAAKPVIREVVRFVPMPGRASIRYAGEGGAPYSPGSSTVYGCGSVDTRGAVRDLDPVTVAACLSHVLARKTAWYFLLRSDYGVIP